MSLPIKKILLSSAIILLMSISAKSQMISLRTDMLKDMLMTPDLGIDLVIGEKETIGLEAFYNNGIYGKDFHMFGLQPDYKFWFNGRPFTRQYIGVVALLLNYDIWMNSIIYESDTKIKRNIDTNYNGDAFGLGVSFGHVITLSDHFNIELDASAGCLIYRQRYYYKGDSYSDIGNYPNSHGYHMIPIRLGASLVYVIK